VRWCSRNGNTSKEEEDSRLKREGVLEVYPF